MQKSVKLFMWFWRDSCDRGNGIGYSFYIQSSFIFVRFSFRFTSFLTSLQNSSSCSSFSSSSTSFSSCSLFYSSQTRLHLSQTMLWMDAVTYTIELRRLCFIQETNMTQGKKVITAASLTFLTSSSRFFHFLRLFYFYFLYSITKEICMKRM